MIRTRTGDTHLKFIKRTIAAQLHLIATGIALAGGLYLAFLTYSLPDSKHFVGAVAYGTAAILVFAASSFYHFLADGFIIARPLSRWLDKFDHVAIFLFIAGTYTPVLLNESFHGHGALLIAVWTIAIVGVFYTLFKSFLPKWAQHRYFYTTLFLMMGWILLLRLGAIVDGLPRGATALLMGGALAYSLGAVVFATKRPRLFHGVFSAHELWHVMVMVGFAFHYFMILKFYA